VRTSIFFAALLALTACTGGAEQGECDKGCRNFYQLHYWEDVELEAAKLPDDAARDKLRKERLGELETRMMKGIPQCVAQCAKAASPEQTKCMIEAKSTAEAKKCLE
jgi:hypothetical protein